MDRNWRAECPSSISQDEDIEKPSGTVDKLHSTRALGEEEEAGSSAKGSKECEQGSSLDCKTRKNDLILLTKI